VKRVWIVGAGFSRSLGAPLLKDLLSPAARMAIASRYSDLIEPADADQVFMLYHYGTDFEDGAVDPVRMTDGVRRWRDAEHFLETLDEACENEATAAELQRLWQRFRSVCGIGSDFREALPPPTVFRRTAKRIVAASCAGFVEGMTKNSVRVRERWLPYLNWLGRLRNHDTIISFNYDRVIELLRPEVRGDGGNVHEWAAHVAGIDGSISDLELASEAQSAGLPTLLKLHGSVDWVVAGDKVERREWNRSLLGAANEPAIATPGPLKMTMAEGFFQRLWKHAEIRLTGADQIYVLGFRFPESDAHPRERLLRAIHANQGGKLRVNVILGPDVLGKDSRRVLDLLEWSVTPSRLILDPKARAEFRVEDTGVGVDERVILAQALFVEDFLTLWANATDMPPARPAAV